MQQMFGARSMPEAMNQRRVLIRQGVACYQAGRQAEAIQWLRRALFNGGDRANLRSFFQTLMAEWPGYRPARTALEGLSAADRSSRRGTARPLQGPTGGSRHGRDKRRLAEALELIAQAYESFGRPGTAEKYWAQVSKLEPGHRGARRAMEGAWLKRAYRQSAHGERRALRRSWDALVKLNPRLDDASLSLGSARADKFCALVSAGRYGEAFKVGEAILDREPTLQDLRAFWHPWRPARLAGHAPRHVAALERLARRQDALAWPHYYLGILREDLSALERAAAFPPRRYGWMSFKLGHLSLAWSRFDQALSCFKRALRFRPVDWRIHGFMSEAYLCLGLSGRAFREMDRAARIVPKEEASQVTAWRGALHLWLGNYAEALRELDMACEGGALWARCWRGGAKLKLGRPQEALADLDEAIRLYPDDLEAHVWRGEAKRELGMHAEALADLKRKPAMMWAGMNRGLVKAALKDSAGLRTEFDAIPLNVLTYLKRKTGLSDKRNLSVADRIKVLREGLRLGRGYRHDNAYGNSIWMV